MNKKLIALGVIVSVIVILIGVGIAYVFMQPKTPTFTFDDYSSFGYVKSEGSYPEAFTASYSIEPNGKIIKGTGAIGVDGANLQDKTVDAAQVKEITDYISGLPLQLKDAKGMECPVGGPTQNILIYKNNGDVIVVYYFGKDACKVGQGEDMFTQPEDLKGKYQGYITDTDISGIQEKIESITKFE